MRTTHDETACEKILLSNSTGRMQIEMTMTYVTHPLEQLKSEMLVMSNLGLGGRVFRSLLVETQRNLLWNAL